MLQGLSADQTKKRIDQILHKYKALSKQSVKSSRKSPAKVTSAEDKPPIDEKTSQSELSTPAAEENLPVFSQTAFLDKIIANKVITNKVITNNVIDNKVNANKVIANKVVVILCLDS